MKITYLTTERKFEQLTEFATKILGNSISFIVAFLMVVYWWSTNLFSSNDMHQNIGDIIFGTTFLSLFVIQKSFNRYAALIHLKMNELISSHQPANNAVMNMSQKTEKEIVQLYENYMEEIEIVEAKLEEKIETIVGKKAT